MTSLCALFFLLFQQKILNTETLIGKRAEDTNLRRTHEETEANSVEPQLGSTSTSAFSILLLLPCFPKLMFLHQFIGVCHRAEAEAEWLQGFKDLQKF